MVGKEKHQLVLGIQSKMLCLREQNTRTSKNIWKPYSPLKSNIVMYIRTIESLVDSRSLRNGKVNFDNNPGDTKRYSCSESSVAVLLPGNSP